MICQFAGFLIKFCSLPSRLSPFHCCEPSTFACYDIYLFLWVAQTFMPCHLITAFSVLEKLFSPGRQFTFSCWEILREPNFSLASLYIEIRKFNRICLSVNTVIWACSKQVPFCYWHLYWIQSQPRCFTASSPLKMRNQVKLVMVIIYSAKSR